jgi:hypothetical protein
LIFRLGAPDRGRQFSQASWIYIADRNHFEIAGAKSHHMKSRTFRRQLTRLRTSGPLSEKDRNAMLANAIDQLGRWLVAKVSQVRAIKSDVTRQALRQIEAERDFPLEPRLHRVPVARDNLQRLAIGKRRNVLIEDLGNQGCAFS